MSGWLSMVFVTCICLFVPWQTTFAESDKPLKTFRAQYSVENDYITAGNATVSLLKNSEGSFDFIIQTSPRGIFKWSGKGKIREHSVLPSLAHPFESVRYSYTDKGDSDRNYQIDFDRKNNKFSTTRGTKTVVDSLEPGTLDRLSMTLLLLHEFQNNANFSTFEAKIQRRSRVQKIVFTNEGSERIDTGSWETDATRINIKREASNRKTIMWLATTTADSQVIPIKIEQFRHDKLTMRLNLTKILAVE